MSRIDDLIAELCPDGVPYKPLGEVGVFARGNGLQKSDLTDEGLPAVHYGQVHTYYGVSTDTTKSFTTPNLYARLRHAKPGDLIIATTSEDTESVGKATAWIGEGEVAVSGDAYVFSHSMESKFVSYFFNSRSFHEQKLRFVTGAKVRRISGDAMAKIIIPVPPLEVQREIVRVLDQFTQLEAELEAELEARRRQYEFYRDCLLAFDTHTHTHRTSVRWVTMSEFGSFYGGLSGKSKVDFADGNSRFISYANVFKNIATDLGAEDFVRVNAGEKQNMVARGDVLFTGSSESADEVAMSSVVQETPGESIYLNSFSVGYRPFDQQELDPAFSKHLFRSSRMRRQLIRCASGVTRFNVSKKRLGRVQVPIPSRDSQVQIARTLDKFDALVNDLSVGLPAELAARRKQYEYYRDKLLTFKELPA